MTKNPIILPNNFHQTSSTRTERDQLAEERQHQIREKAKLELDLKDLDDICNDDLATKVCEAISIVVLH